MNWQPIATAPKDGTRVLCYQPAGQWKTSGKRTHGEEIVVAYWFQPSRPGVEGMWVPSLRPTHWMPLPAAPQPEKEEEHEG